MMMSHGPYDVLARLAATGTPPDGPQALRLSVGLDKTLKLLEAETFPFLAGGGAEVRFIYAPYGRGKTHLLLTLQEAARRHGLITAYIDCQAENAPFASLEQTYRQIAQNLQLPHPLSDNSRRRGVDTLVTGVIEQFAGNQTGLQDRMQQLRRASRLTTDFRNTVLAYGRSLLHDHLGDLRQELRSLLCHEIATRITITSIYRRYGWVPRPLGKMTKRTAPLWLRSLLSLPLALGYPGCCIFFDETEKTLTKLYRRDRQLYWANLRNLADHLALGSIQGCALIFAVVEEFLEEAKIDLDALSQRLERPRLPIEQRLPNPRALWVDIDELTYPGPDTSEFFQLLAERLLDLGREAGLAEAQIERLRDPLYTLAMQAANSIRTGAVRDFVKETASRIVTALSIGT